MHYVVGETESSSCGLCLTRELQPISYLLKPIDEKRLARAITMAQNTIFNQTEKLVSAIDETHGSTTNNYKKLKIKELCSASSFVDYDRITYISVSENITYVHTAKSVYETRTTLKDLLQELGNDNFVQIHRNYLFNHGYSGEYRIIPDGNGAAEIVVSNCDDILPVSRHYYRGWDH